MVTATSVNSLLDILYKAKLLLDFPSEISGILEKFKLYRVSLFCIGISIIVIILGRV